MKRDLPSIIDKESGKTAIVMGMGPSLNKHLEKIQNLSEKKHEYVIVACNDADVLKFKFDYWVWANSESTIKKIHERLVKQNALLVYADSVDLTPRKDVEKLLAPITYVPYDQRHFNLSNKTGVGCTGKKCCKHIIQGRLTIQEEFQKYTKNDKLNTSSDTVAIPMLYLSVLLGCKNIYVTGIDLDYSKGYVNNYQKVEPSSIKAIKDSRSRILQSIEFIHNAAKNINTNIYCLDQNLPISNILEYKPLP